MYLDNKYKYKNNLIYQNFEKTENMMSWDNRNNIFAICICKIFIIFCDIFNLDNRENSKFVFDNQHNIIILFLIVLVVIIIFLYIYLKK